MLQITDLIYRIGGRLLFDGASLRIAQGQRVGLVGRNGSGKSTLFRLLLGDAQADGGQLSVRPRARIGTVAQETPDGPESLLECVLAHDPERMQLLAAVENGSEPHRLAELHDRLAAIEAHSAPARAAAILSGLGFDAEAQSRAVGSFSGGWRMRVSLAGALFANPDLLLLDEPTNHLDLEATLWLENYLASYPGTLLVISHDRELLNIVAERIVHIDQGKLVAYGGNYDRFEKTRQEKMELAGKAAGKQMEQRQKLQAFIDRFRAKATKAAQAQSRIKMLERLGPPLSVIEERTISFDFPDPEALAPPMLTVERGEAGYAPGQPVLRQLSFRIDMADRIALLGANGNGKSTLAKILADRLTLQNGTIWRSPKLRIGYFAQNQMEELNPLTTPFNHMQALMPLAAESKVRAQLGRFGFGQERANVKVSNLSGGEKARLLFALMSRDAPHLMILDEPTNHLDIDSREALVTALNAYEGAVILISHDPHLIELAADQLWLVADGRVQDFDGDLEAYRRLLLDQARESRRDDRQGKQESRRGDRRSAAERRQQLAPLRKAAQDAEKLVERLGRRKTELQAELADPRLYDGPAEKVTAAQRTLADAEKALAQAEEAWLLAHDALEKAEDPSG
ncbi:MAG TPA: ABC-F family ATP-binding cassette domain-containing protein [Rhodospirillaceae bacterium]|nr:ABC-F family ATP-binding cassette domain-containing protein [Rhodospirillaceae bacterium]